MRVMTQEFPTNSHEAIIWGCSDLTILDVVERFNKTYVIYMNEPSRDQEYKALVYRTSGEVRNYFYDKYIATCGMYYYFTKENKYG